MVDEELTAKISMADTKFSFQEVGRIYSPAWMSPEGSNCFFLIWKKNQFLKENFPNSFYINGCVLKKFSEFLGKVNKLMEKVSEFLENTEIFSPAKSPRRSEYPRCRHVVVRRAALGAQHTRSAPL